MNKRPNNAVTPTSGEPAGPAAALRLKPLAAQVRRALFPGLIIGLHAGAAFAGPEGGRVVGGSGSIARPNATTTVIRQQSANLAIDWQKFNVKPNELVQFRQPGRNAQALNRIFDQNASQIHGRLRANGRVLLMNPNGVIFGPTAQVNVNSLVAAGMRNIPVEDFMAGKFRLEALDGADGVVINEGTIEAAAGGDVTFAGKAIRNEGVIIASAGRVNLAAGNKVTLDFDGDGLIRFAVDEAVLDNARALDAQITNSGTVAAEGGEVIMAASAAAAVFDQAINNSGVIRAGRIDNSGGKIRLVGLGPAASVINTGTLDASARDGASSGGAIDITGTNIRQAGFVQADASGGAGGSVRLAASDTAELTGEGSISARGTTGGQAHVLGDKVGLRGANTIDVSGVNGGGEVLLGGDYQGDNPAIENARATYVSEDSAIFADALENGDGGRIIVWADRATRFHGSASARGGEAGGNGGFVEVSGKDYLDFNGLVNTLAPHGVDGILLLDPADIYIADSLANAQGAGMPGADVTADDGTPGGGVYEVETGAATGSFLGTGTIETQLETGNVVINATGGGAGDGDIFVVDAIQPTNDLGANRSLTMLAQDITVNAVIDASAEAGGDHSLDVILNATNNGGGTLDINAPITTNGGLFTATATNNVEIVDAGIVTAGGTVDITAGGTIRGAEATNATANIAAGAGDIILSAGTGIGDAAGTGGLDIDADSGSTVEIELATSGAARIDYESTDADALTLDLDNNTINGDVEFVSGATGTLSLTDANIDAGSLIVTSGGAINLNQRLDLTDGAGDVTLTATTSGIVLGNADDLIDAGAGTVTLNATAGAITALEATGDGGTEINTTGAIVFNAASVGTSGNRVGFENATALTIMDGGGTGTDVELQELGTNTTLAALDITSASATAGGITIDLLGGNDVVIGEGHVLTTVTLNDATTSATFDYTATAGDIAVGSIDTRDQAVTLTAAAGGIDEIVDDTAAKITTSGTLTLLATGGAIGDNADGNAPLDIDVANLNASTDTGGIFIRELDGLAIIDGSGGGGANGVRTTGGNADVEITLAAGDLALTAPIVTNGAGDVIVNVAGNITDADAAVDIQSAGNTTLVAGGAIGGAAADAAIDLDVSALQGTAGNTGIFLVELDTVTADGLVINGTGLQTTANDAVIDVTITTGDLQLDEDISADGAGTVTLTLLGPAATLVTDNANDDITSASGAITIIADNLNLAAGEIITTGTISLRPNDTAREINLGTGTGGMDLTTGELDLIDTTAQLIIGGPSHVAAINLTSDVDTGNANTTSTLLQTTVGIDSNNAANEFTEATLALSGTDIGATNPFGVDSSALTANASAGNLDIANRTTMIAAELDASGTVTFVSDAAFTSSGDMSAQSFDLTTTTGDLTIAHNVTTTGGAGSGNVALTSAGMVNLDPTGAADITILTTNANDLVFMAATSIFIDQETATDTGVANINLNGGNVAVDPGAGNSLGLGDDAVAGAVSNFEIGDAAMQALIDATTAPVVFGTAAAGAILLDTATDFGARSFGVITGATIDDVDGGSDALQTTGTLLLTSTGAVGSGGDPFALNVSNLGLTTGAADITNAAALTVVDSTVTGALSLATTSGNLTLNAITATGLTVTLNAAGAITDANGATSNITATALDATAASGIDLDTTIDMLTAAGGAGAINISDADALTVTSATTTDGAITIAAGNTLSVTLIDAQDLGADELHDVTLTTAAGDIALGGVTADNQVVLNAAGAVTDANAAATNVTAISLDATAASGIDLDTDVTQITAAGGAGTIDLNELDAVTLVNIATTDGAITVTSGNTMTVTAVDAQDAGADESHDVSLTTVAGDIVLTTVAADDQITLNAAGAITDNNGAATNLTGLVLDASAASGIDVDTTVGSITAVLSAAGAIDISETDAVTLTNVMTTDGMITVNSGGMLTVTAVDAQDAGGDDTHNVSLTTAAGDIVVTSITADNQAVLDAAGAITDNNAGATNITAIGLDATAASGIDIDTAVDTIAAAGGAGAIDIDEADAVTLTSVVTTDGAITVDAGNTLTAVLVDAQDAGGDDAHNVVLTTAAGDIDVTIITADNQATLSAAGAITDANGDGTNNITALVLDATAGTGIDTDTTVDSITAAATAGNIDINEADAVTLTSVVAMDGGIVIDAGNTITVTTVDAQDAGGDDAHDVSLTAAAGDISIASNGISADNDAMLSALAGSILASSGTVQLSAGNDVDLAALANIGTITNFATATGTALGISFGNALTNATITQAGGAINLDVGGSLTGGTIAAGAIVVDTDGAAAAIIQSADDLNFASAATAFDAGAGDSIGLVAGNDGTGTLTISDGGIDFTGQNLLLSGATDVVEAGASPRDLTIAATDLGIISGAAGGDIILNLDVTNLSADINGTADMTVNEADAINLVDVAVANGAIDINAGGTVTAMSVVAETDAAANSIDISTTAGNIEVDTISTGGTAGDVILTANTAAGQSITDTDGNSSITADQLDLTANNGAGAIGTTGLRILSTANTVNATAGSGGVFLGEADGAAFTVTAQGAGVIDILSTAGTLDIAGATNTGTGTITLVSGDAVVLNAALGGADDGAISIQANTDGAGAEGFTQNAAATITSGDTGANAIAITVNTAGGGTGAAVIGANMSTGAGGTLTIDTANGGTTGTGISRTAGTLAAGTVALTSGNGDIGALAGRIVTDTGTLNANAQGGSSVFLSEADGVILANVLATDTVDVLNTGAGTIEVNNVTATNSVVINSQGAITEDATNDAAADITATAIDLDAVGAIGQLEIDATSIDADATTTVTLTNLATATATVNSITGTGATLVFNDSVTFSGGTVNLGGGTLNVTVDSGDARTTSLDLSGSTLTFGTFNASGGSDGNDTLIAADVANTWTISANNGGTLVQTAGYTVAFADFGSLTGAATNTDTFIFNDTRTLSGVIEGGTGVAVDTINWAAYTTARDVMLDGAGAADGFDGSEASVNGGAANGFLNIDAIIVGQSVAHSITGLDTASNWTLISSGRTYTDTVSGRTLDLNAAGGTGFVNLNGGSAVDTFQVGQSVEGGDASDTPVMLTLNLDGGAGNDIFNLRGPGGGSILTGNITGGANDDTVNFGFPAPPPTADNTEDSRVTGIVDLGTGSDTINFTGSDLVQTVNSVGGDGTIIGFAIDAGTDLIGGGFLGVETIDGNTLGPLVATDDGNPNVWIITGLNSGTLDGVAFSNFFLQGQTDVDSFEFRSGGRIDIGVDGGATGGTNTVLVDPVGGLTSLIVLDGARSGTIDADTGDGVAATVFSNIDVVQGGSGADTFGFLTNAVAFAGELDGQGGVDTLNLSVLSGPLTVTLTALGATDGYDGNVAVNLATGFRNIDNLVGSGASDTLVGPATNTFFFVNAANAGTVSDADGHDAGGAARLTFSSFENLSGGAGADDFEFSGATGGIAGTIDGGLGDDKIDLVPSGLGGVTVALNANGSLDGRLGTAGAIAAGFDNINAVDGRPVDTLQVNNATTNNWLITGVDEFTLDGSTIPFTGFGGLTGGSGADIFTFEADGQMSAGINGFTGNNTIIGSPVDDTVALTSAGTGTITVNVGVTPLATTFTNIQNFDGDDPTMSDTLDYSGFAGAVSINLAAGTATGTTSITNFETFVGNATSANNTLTAQNIVNQWDITANDAGTINALSATPRTFSNFGNLIGGSAADTFDFADGVSITTSIDGAGGTDVFDYTDDTRATNVSFVNFSATGIAGGAANGFMNVESVIGSATSGANSLTGTSGDDTWTITGADQGTLNGAAFQNFETIDGALGNDVFTANAAGTISTLINGGGGTDTLVGSGFANTWNITADNAGTANGSAFTQVENLSALGSTAALTQSAGIGLSGTMTASTLNLNTAAITTGANPFNLIGNLTSAAAAQSITAGAPVSVSGTLNDADSSFTINAAGDTAIGGAVSVAALTVTTNGGNYTSGAVTTSGATSVNAGAGTATIGGPLMAASANVVAGGTTVGAVTTTGAQSFTGPVAFGGGLSGGVITINGNGGPVSVAGAINATSLNLTSGNGSVRAVTTSGSQTYGGPTTFTGNLTGANLVFNGPSTFNGNVLIQSSTDVYDFNSAVLGTGNLDIIPTANTDIFIGNDNGPGNIAANQFAGFQGHLIIGALLNPLDSPAENAVVVNPPGVTANRIFVNQDFTVGGDVTLIASNINLDASIGAAANTGQVTLVAVGDSQANGGEGPGDITGPISGTSAISGGKAVLIANSTVVNAGNIRLDLNGGDLLLAASANEDEPQFDPSSNASSVEFDPETLAIIAGLGLQLQSVQVVFTNPASALTGLQNVQFIDVGLFEEELTLFGVIGNGIAMSLDQCEEAEGCAPNVSDAELDALIVQIEARIVEIRQRLEAGTINADEGAELLAGFERELENFQRYKTQLTEFAESEGGIGEDDFDELDDFAEEFDEPLPEDDFAEPFDDEPQVAEPTPEPELEPTEEAFEEFDDEVIEPLEPESTDEFEELEENLDFELDEPEIEEIPEEFQDFEHESDEFEELGMRIDEALILRLTQNLNVNEMRGEIGLAADGSVTWVGDIVLPSFARRY